jgi:hypothetical protein
MYLGTGSDFCYERKKEAIAIVGTEVLSVVASPSAD